MHIRVNFNLFVKHIVKTFDISSAMKYMITQILRNNEMNKIV